MKREFLTYPKILAISLSRFSYKTTEDIYDEIRGMMVRNVQAFRVNSLVTFPIDDLTIDNGDLMGSSNIKYNLIYVVQYSGNVGGGHCKIFVL